MFLKCYSRFKKILAVNVSKNYLKGMSLTMSREEDLKRRYELEDKLKDVIVKSSGLSKRLSDITKELSGIDAKVDTLKQKKSGTPPQERSDRIRIYTNTTIILLIIALIVFALLCSASLEQYKLIFTIIIIVIICIFLFLGYAYWNDSENLKRDKELEQEIIQIQNSTNTLFDNRKNIQNDLENITFQMAEIIRELKKLTEIK